jgi:hypothetical protein
MVRGAAHAEREAGRGVNASLPVAMEGSVKSHDIATTKWWVCSRVGIKYKDAKSE